MKQKTESAEHCSGGRCSLTAEHHLPYDTGRIDGVMGDTSEARDRPCLQVLLKQGSALETNTLTVLHQNLLWPVCSLGIACRGCVLFLSDGMCEEGTKQNAGRGSWPRRSLWKWDL